MEIVYEDMIEFPDLVEAFISRPRRSFPGGDDWKHELLGALNSSPLVEATRHLEDVAVQEFRLGTYSGRKNWDLLEGSYLDGAAPVRRIWMPLGRVEREAGNVISADIAISHGVDAAGKAVDAEDIYRFLTQRAIRSAGLTARERYVLGCGNHVISPIVIWEVTKFCWDFGVDAFVGHTDNPEIWDGWGVLRDEHPGFVRFPYSADEGDITSVNRRDQAIGKSIARAVKAFDDLNRAEGLELTLGLDP